MRDLTAHLTSGLLQFPEVTIQALGEDEITLDSVLHGKFAGGRSALACLACGPQLEVVNPITGERLSAYHFSGVNEQPPTILAVKEFSWQKRTGLLIGLEETEGSVLCLYDLGISRVVKAVVLPGRVTAIEPIINHGGASLTTQHLHQSLRWLFGVAAVVTDVGHILLIDLCLDDLSCSQNEIEASDLEVITGIPPEIPQIREVITRKGRHLCFQLLNPTGTAVTTLTYIHRSNQLVVGFSDGYLSLWNMKTLKKEYHSQLEGGRIPVYTVTFQEPENDPRNCCYLWAVQSTQESEGDIVSLHLLQLAFSDRRRLASGQIMYEGLEYCEERYSLELTGGVFSLRGQTSNTKLIGCQTIEKFRSHVDREDGINEVVSPDTSVSVFTWQVNTYGQGKPSTYLGIFDINRWYHAQMPDSLRPGEFLHNCSYFALWSLDDIVSITSPHRILDVLVHERSLSRGVPPSYPPPEQFFNPSTYNFDATCLLNSGVIHVVCTGFQKDTLHFLKQAGCSLNEAIPDSYNRCLVAGLLSPRFIDVQPSNLSQEEQLEAVLSAAVQTSSLGLLTTCIRQWTAEEQPGSAPNLRFVLEWTWNKVVHTKEEFVRLCIPLFNGSSNFIDPQTLQSLQHCELLLSNLSTILSCFVTEAQELTEKGITDLTNKQTVISLLSQYVQVVNWFCRANLLPEGLDEDLQLSKPFYNYQQIQCFYASCRQKLERSSRGKWNPDCLMIDGLVSQLGSSVVKQWRQRDVGGTGKYPPATLHALLDLYLLENTEEFYKHAITIYLLLDIMHSYPNKSDTSVDSFPTAFAVPIGLVNLIQGFWCLDHSDYENSLTYLFHPSTIKLVWQHERVIQALMCQGEHRQALRYIQTMKPSITSSSEVALHLTVLLFNSCMVEAWSVLRQHSTRLNVEEMLKHMYDLCQELGLMEDLLKLPFTETEQECLEKFLQTSTGVHNHEFLLVHHLQHSNYIPAVQLNQSLKTNLMNDRDPHWRERSVVRNSILDQYGKVLPRVQRKLAAERAKPYHLSSLRRQEVLRPKPLSTVAKKIATGNVLTKATFINNVLSKIGEVWAGTEQNTKSLQNDTTEEQLARVDSCADTELPDAFVGTPVTKSLRNCSRLLDLVVQPVPLYSPPLGNSLWGSPRASASCVFSSPSHSKPRCSRLLQKNVARAPELTLLETPTVVKRVKALTSASCSSFPGFTPQSILRSSLRTTPLATPTASPGRSITPPLRAKETKISFLEESKVSEWTAKVIDPNTKHNTGSSECNIEFPGKVMWPKIREMSSFPACSPQDDCVETDLSSESISEDNLNKTESTKEACNSSVKSDQTLLEYHYAKAPCDFGDRILASPSADSFPEAIVHVLESAAKESSEVVGSASLQVEPQIASAMEHVAGFPDREENKCYSFPEDGEVAKDYLNVVDEDSVVSSLIPANERLSEAVLKCSMPPLLRDNRLLADGSSQDLEPVGDTESVISIPDSEDTASIHSKNELEEQMVVRKVGSEEAGREENIVLQEKIPHAVVPDSQEVNRLQDDVPEEQVSEAVVEALPCRDLSSPSPLKCQYSYGTTENQVAWELLGKDGDKCDFSEGDEEVHLPQSNFTLRLEGDEEAEMGDPSAVPPVSVEQASLQSEKIMDGAGNNDQECNTNSVSAVTSDQMSENAVEVLPYVPEPIKVAIAENLLDVIKDTRSKEFATGIVEQGIHGTIRKEVLSFPQVPLQNAAETNTERKLNQVETLLTSSASTAKQTTESVNAQVPDGQSLTKMDQPDLSVQQTPRRSARRTKEYSDIPKSLSLSSKTKVQEQQTQQAFAYPVRGAKKAQGCDLEIPTNHPIAQAFQASITRRGVRKPKEVTSELCDLSPSALKRTARSTGSIVGDKEGSQFIIDHTIQMTVNPKSARKLKSIAFHLTENVISDQEVEPCKQQLSVTPRRGRPRKYGIVKVVSPINAKPEKQPLSTPIRKGRSKKSSLPGTISEEDVQPSETQLPASTRQERTLSTSISETVSEQNLELLEQLPVRRKRGRPRKNPLDVSACSELNPSLLSPLPQTDAKSFVSARRITRSAALNLSISTRSLPSLEETAVETVKRRSTRVTSKREEKTSTEKCILEEHPVQPSEVLVSVKSTDRRKSKMTGIKKKCQLPSVSEEEEEVFTQTTEKSEGLQSEDMTKLRLGETGRILTPPVATTKRTRYIKRNMKHSFSIDGNEVFSFSPPLTKLTEKLKGEKPVTPVQLKDLDADFASQFVFSPPVLRSRKKQTSNVLRTVKELELPIKEEEDAISIDAVEKQKVKKGRATRSKSTKTSRIIGNDSSWSPPPMEIKFISPFGTPADRVKKKRRESADKTEKPVQKTVVRRKEKRLSSYPKPVVRKKML